MQRRSTFRLLCQLKNSRTREAALTRKAGAGTGPGPGDAVFDFISDRKDFFVRSTACTKMFIRMNKSKLEVAACDANRRQLWETIADRGPVMIYTIRLPVVEMARLYTGPYEGGHRVTA
jgi:hypothetical protein